MALVASVFSLKIRCSLSMKRSTSLNAMSDRKSCTRKTTPLKRNSACAKHLKMINSLELMMRLEVLGTVVYQKQEEG